ncbi:MAG: flagellar hook-length control protein FliK [Gammaproteobacteria bacterium]|nr:flagellar hook-length control protein FliK [Gammaproteobacteria bacterium]
MPGATPLLLPTQAAAKQVSKTAKPQQAGVGEQGSQPFSQALATQLAATPQNNTAGQNKGQGGSLPEVGALLPLDGEVLPPPLSPNTTDGALALERLTAAGPEAGTAEGLVPAVPLSPATGDVSVALPSTAASLPRPETAAVVNAAADAASATAQDEAGALPLVPPAADAVLVQGGRGAQQSVRQEGRLAGTADAIAQSSTATSAAVTHDPRPQRAEAPILMQLSVPLQDPGWDQAVAQRVLWMVKQGAQGAELRINPPGLGTVEVRVMLGSNDQARVSFTSAHAEVREALEAALPRLREMLHANGLSLAGTDVSAHSFAEQRQAAQYQGRAHPGAAAGDPDQPGADTDTEAVVKLPVGLLDLYA